MDPTTFQYSKTLHIHHFKPDEVPWRRLGQYLYRIIEDGSNTQYRLAAIESLLPPRSNGPVFHFHEMHDEGFYVTKGTVRFHCPGRPDVDAKAGDMITIPIRLPHRFSNPFDEEAIFVNTITPGFFVRYFAYLEDLIGEGNELTEEFNRAALTRFATIPLGEAALAQLTGPESGSRTLNETGPEAGPGDAMQGARKQYPLDTVLDKHGLEARYDIPQDQVSPAIGGMNIPPVDEITVKQSATEESTC